MVILSHANLFAPCVCTPWHRLQCVTFCVMGGSIDGTCYGGWPRVLKAGLGLRFNTKLSSIAEKGCKRNNVSGVQQTRDSRCVQQSRTINGTTKISWPSCKTIRGSCAYQLSTHPMAK
eukprot:678167-Pelagomonas_calceolata.AAC.8